MATAAPPERNKVHGIHYTPEALANAVADRLSSLLTGSQPIIVADPACGDGSLLDAFARVASRNGLRCRLHGYELDADAAQRARTKLAKWSGSTVEVSDFLQGRTRRRDLFAASTDERIADVIIANPPYVRTQVMGREQARDIAERFHITGRVDLAYAFCMAMVDSLHEGGYFAFILSNKFLTIKAGASLRPFFERETELLDIWDLGDSRLFSAAVLPCVVFGRRVRGRVTEGIPFRSIYSATGQTDGHVCSSPSELLDLFRSSESGAVARYVNQSWRIRRGVLAIKPTDKTWVLQDVTVRGVQQHHTTSRTRRFAQVFRTKVGIKTTADAVFIRNDWNSLPEDVRPEEELLWPIRLAADTRRWLATHADTLSYSVLYPFRRDLAKRTAIKLDDYPRSRAYFDQHRSLLEARKYVVESGRQWFEPWVAHQPHMWQRPRAVFPEISEHSLFALEESAIIPNGTVFWMHELSGEPELIRAGIAIANTGFAVEYYDLMMGTKLYASRRRWNSQHVGELPFPATDSDARLFIELCDEAIAATSADDNATLLRVEAAADAASRAILGGGIL